MFESVAMNWVSEVLVCMKIVHALVVSVIIKPVDVQFDDVFIMLST